MFAMIGSIVHHRNAQTCTIDSVWRSCFTHFFGSPGITVSQVYSHISVLKLASPCQGLSSIDQSYCWYMIPKYDSVVISKVDLCADVSQSTLQNLNMLHWSMMANKMNTNHARE